MKLSFHGGAREVTGACYLLQTARTKLLIDCGMFQGCDECADMNFAGFSFDPAGMDALVVTHAHLDHVGRIPMLIRKGFAGKIFSTAPTRDLARLILQDALSLARRQDRQLFEERDIQAAFGLWEGVPYHQEIEVGDMVFELSRSGHILGSALVRVRGEEKNFLFTGDLGNVPSILLPPPDAVSGVEYLITESTYGNRTHESVEERAIKLERAIEDTVLRGGTLMIPAFATERTQDILHLLNEMARLRRIPDLPVFVDSPLAIRVTEVYERYTDEYRDDIRSLLAEQPDLFKFKRLRLTESVEDSKRINDIRPPKVIIAGSGMMAGGRILHHARRYLQDEKSMLLIIGYQSAGSLGRRLIDGAGSVKIMGEEVPVRAEIRKIGGFSAHADGPQLFDFAASNRDTLKRVFAVQGEPAAALHLVQEIRDRLGVPADAPMLHDEVEL